MGYHLSQELANLRISDSGERTEYLIGQTDYGIRRVPAGGGSSSQVLTIDAARIAESSVTPIVLVPAGGNGGWNELVSISTQTEPGDNPFATVVGGAVSYEGASSFAVLPIAEGASSSVSIEHIISFQNDRHDVENKAIVMTGDVAAVNDNNTNVCVITVTYASHKFVTPTPPPMETRSKKRK